MQRGAQSARRLLGMTSARVGAKKRQKTKENNGFVCFAGAQVGNQKKFPCSVALKVLGVTFSRGPKVLAGPHGTLDSAVPIWAIRMQKSVPMQRGAHLFEKKTFPCSVALIFLIWGGLVWAGLG